MSDTKESFEQFLQGIVYRDWVCEFPTIEAAVDSFVENEKEWATEVYQELINIGAHDLSVEEAEVVYLSYSPDYWPPGVGKTCKEWLVELEERFALKLHSSS